MRNLHSESVTRHWRLLLIALVVVLLAASACKSVSLHLSLGQPAERAYSQQVSLDNAVTAYNAQAAPDGVNPALYARLKSALREELLRVQYARTVSQPPSGDESRIADLGLAEDEGDYYLSWSYRNLGDYNQDGEVGIADITPIAMHYNEEVPEEDGELDKDSLQAVIDGSGNGTVDISDITPLAMNFGVSLERYVVQTSADEAQTWEEAMPSVPVDAATGEGRKSFEVLLESPVERNIYRVVPYTGEEEGEASNAVRYFTSELVLILETPPESGAGTAEDPYVVLLDAPYELRVEDDEEVDVSDSVEFENTPPAFVTFTPEVPRVMTVENVMAGDFTVVALMGEIAPMPSGTVYFRAQGDLPP